MKTIFIIEDHPLVMESLVSYFKDSGNWKILGKALSLAAAKKEILKLTVKPDVLLLDIQLEDDWGLDIIPWLKKKSFYKKKQFLIAVYTAFDDYGHVSAAMKLGVKAYITKTRSKQELEKAIFNALSGIVCIDENAQMKLNAVTNLLSMLTKREMEIFSLVKSGLSNKEIASQLGISFRTVENILSCVYDKTGIDSRKELEKL